MKKEHAELLYSVIEQPRICKHGGSGMFLPLSDNEAPEPRHDDDAQIVRGLVYMVILFWFFAGVAVSSDVFMSGIEKITSQKVRVQHPEDKNRMVTVAVWNDTVANLTLMAFGSSTPEILLSIIELFAADYFMGELGANTIVGSASFNLLLIIGLCISVIPSDEVRMIKDTGVYHLTAFVSIFAYFWLFFVLQITTPNRVTIPEAVITFLFFPLLIAVSYAADTGIFTLSKDKSKDELTGLSAQTNNLNNKKLVDLTEEEIEQYAANLRKKFGKEIGTEKVLKLLEIELAPKTTRAGYRQNVVRALTNKNKNNQRQSQYQEESEVVPNPETGKSTETGRVSGILTRNQQNNRGSVIINQSSSKKPQMFWDVPGNAMACLECCGQIEVPVRMMPCNKKARVFYETRDGTAKDGQEYVSISGYLEFPASTQEQVQFVKVTIIDDDESESDRDFYIDLFAEEDDAVEIYGPTCVITVIDDDDPGVFSWKQEQVRVSVLGSTVEVTAIRRKGAAGKIEFTVCTEEGTARENLDFEPLDETHVVFKHEELEKSFTIRIPSNKNRSHDGKEFRVLMTDIKGGAVFQQDTDGGNQKCICTITFDKGDQIQMLHQAQVKILNNWESVKEGSTSWRMQFVHAFWVNGTREDSKDASWKDIISHVTVAPWKLLCSFAPPPVYLNGWFTFVTALGIIGLQTAFVADLAELVGCCFDIPDSVTAITIVALGTSLPDTFASKSAALQDEYADSSITNVTGSNSVNVFMGLGIPWTIGSIYWAYEGITYEWKNRIAGQRNGLRIIEENPDGGLIHYGDELGISLIAFTSCALIALLILEWRRNFIGGEFGGPSKYKYGTSLVFFSLWVVYLSVSSYSAINEENKWNDAKSDRTAEMLKALGLSNGGR